MVCPLLGGQCVKDDCRLWFQELDEDFNPGECGCSIQMMTQYIHEVKHSCEEIVLLLDQDIKESLHGIEGNTLDM